MINLTATEIERLNAAQTDEQWNAACLAVKRTRGNAYPPDWAAVVLQDGGVYEAFQKRMGRTGSGIEVRGLDPYPKLRG
jgi:hypothetical protein